MGYKVDTQAFMGTFALSLGSLCLATRNFLFRDPSYAMKIVSANEYMEKWILYSLNVKWLTLYKTTGSFLRYYTQN